MPANTGPASSPADQKATHNERVKLVASTLNTIGLGLIGTGVVVPMISLLYGGEPPTTPLSIYVGIWCIVMAIVLHLTAHIVLGRIKA